MYSPARMMSEPQIFLIMDVAFEVSFQFAYFWTSSVEVAARTITEQCPAAYAVNNTAARGTLTEAALNVTAMTGARYAKVHGPRAIPNKRPMSRAASGPVRVMGIFAGAFIGRFIRPMRTEPKKRNMAATK